MMRFVKYVFGKGQPCFGYKGLAPHKLWYWRPRAIIIRIKNFKDIK